MKDTKSITIDLTPEEFAAVVEASEFVNIRSPSEFVWVALSQLMMTMTVTQADDEEVFWCAVEEHRDRFLHRQDPAWSHPSEPVSESSPVAETTLA